MLIFFNCILKVITPQGTRLLAPAIIPATAVNTKFGPAMPGHGIAMTTTTAAIQPTTLSTIHPTLTLPIQLATAIPAQTGLTGSAAMAIPTGIPLSATSLQTAAVAGQPMALNNGTLTPISLSVSQASSTGALTLTATPISLPGLTQIQAAPPVSVTMPTATQQQPSVDIKAASSKEAHKAGETSSARSGEGDYDPVKAMDWDNGIGSLPGSNLKVICCVFIYS